MKQLTTGFSDPVHQSQTCFRQLLTAMSEPGTIVDLTGQHSTQVQFGELSSALTASLLTLCDHTTPVYLGGEFNCPAVRENLIFHTSAPLTDDPNDAEFAVLSLAEFTSMRPFKIGDEAQPQLSCSFLIQVSSFDQGTALQLSGPGIPTRRALTINGLSDAQVAMLQVNHQQFPLGYDCYFFHNSQAVALPRSTKIEKEAPCTSQ